MSMTKNFVDSYKEHSQFIEYCGHCLEARGYKSTCCDYHLFIELRQFSDEDQLSIVEKEYAKAFGEKL